MILAPFITRYTVLIAVLIFMAFLLSRAGFFAFVKRVAVDCLLDHSTGRYTTNNLARFLTLICFLILFITVHIEVHIKPAFIIRTIPFTEWEMLIITAFIVGAEWVKKTNAQPTIQ